MGSSVNNSRRIIVQFTNRKFAKKTLLNRSKPLKITSTSPNYNVFRNENLTLRKVKLIFFIENLKMQTTPRKHLQEMVQYRFPAQISKRKSIPNLPSK